MTDDKEKKTWENAAPEAAETETYADHVFDHRFSEGRPIAYIRKVSRQEVEGALPPNAPDGPYFALHDGDGRPLALFSDAESAWAAARANNLETVSVH